MRKEWGVVASLGLAVAERGFRQSLPSHWDLSRYLIKAGIIPLDLRSVLLLTLIRVQVLVGIRWFWDCRVTGEDFNGIALLPIAIIKSAYHNVKRLPRQFH